VAKDVDSAVARAAAIAEDRAKLDGLYIELLIIT
jgi:hypothetical protein